MRQERRDRHECERRVQPVPSSQRMRATPKMTHLVGWPRHETMDATRAFVSVSDGEWARWSAGLYLVLSREDGTFLGSTGLLFRRPIAPPLAVCWREMRGAVATRPKCAARSADAMVDVARAAGVRIYALCHNSIVRARASSKSAGYSPQACCAAMRSSRTSCRSSLGTSSASRRFPETGLVQRGGSVHNRGQPLRATGVPAGVVHKETTWQKKQRVSGNRMRPS